MGYPYPQGAERKDSCNLENTCSKGQQWFFPHLGMKRDCSVVCRTSPLGCKGRTTEMALGYRPSFQYWCSTGISSCSTRQPSEPHPLWVALLAIGKIIRSPKHPVGNCISGCKAASHRVTGRPRKPCWKNTKPRLAPT